MLKRLILTVAAALLSSCAASAPISTDSRVSNPTSRQASNHNEQSGFSTSRLSPEDATFEPTPFTLGLIGEASQPEGGYVPDINNVTDLAYCAILFERDAYQSGAGSDFSRSATQATNFFKNRILTATGSQSEMERYLDNAYDIADQAFRLARGGDMQATMAFNFGGHKRACAAAIENP